MSDPKKPTEDQQAPSITPDKAKQDRKMKRRFNLQNIILGIAIGIMLGVLYAQNIVDYLPNIVPTLMAVAIAFFVLLTILILALPSISNYFIKRYTGKEMDLESVAGDIQKKTNSIADAIANVVLIKADPEVKRNIRTDLPDILHYLIFSRLRSGGLRLLLTVFAAVGGLMGTILLYNQNQLLTGQNELLLNQNRKIDIQTSLMESERRGAQVVLMGNVLEDMSAEIQRQKNEGVGNDSTSYELSSSLIGRIAATSQGFMPYKFLQGDTLTIREYSLERGQLLLALLKSRIHTKSIRRIYMDCTFESAYMHNFKLKYADLNYADLRRAELREADLSGASLSGANLNRADLENANLIFAKLIETNLKDANLSYAHFNFAKLDRAHLNGANLHRANLSNAHLNGAELNEVNLNGASLIDAQVNKAFLNWADLNLANLTRVDLSDTYLSEARLKEANLSEAHLVNTHFNGADLRGADLQNADLQGAIGVSSEMLKFCRSIYQIKGLSDSLITTLKKEITTKPELIDE